MSYSLPSRNISVISCPSTPCPDRAQHLVFTEESVSGDNMAGGADAIKRRFSTHVLKLTMALARYDPDKLEAMILATNATDWKGEVITALNSLIDFAGQMLSGDVTEEEETAINDIVKTNNDLCQDYLVRYHAKTLEVATTPATPVNTSNGSNASSDFSQEMKKKHAKVDVSIDAEMVADGVKSLGKELAKVSDWTRADSHDVERAMTQVTRWQKELSFLKKKVYAMKLNTNCYDLDDTDYLRCDSVVSSLETELERVR